MKTLFLIVMILTGSAWAAEAPTTASIVGGLPNLAQVKGKELPLSRLPKDKNGDPYVARVNGTSITARRLTGAIRESVFQARGADATVKEWAMAEPVLDMLIGNRIVADFAASKAIKVSDAEVQEEITLRNNSLPPGRKMQDQALTRGLRPADLQDEVREFLLSRKMEKYMRWRVPYPTSAELQEFAKKQSSRISSTTCVRAAHIVFRAVPGQSEQQNEDSRRRAEALLEKLANGMDFGEAAKRYSQDANTAELGGDLGYFTKGAMFQEFDQVVFSLKPGDISSIVKTPVGYHIIKLLDRQENDAQVLYRNMHARSFMTEFYSELRQKATIEKFL